MKGPQSLLLQTLPLQGTQPGRSCPLGSEPRIWPVSQLSLFLSTEDLVMTAGKGKLRGACISAELFPNKVLFFPSRALPGDDCGA